MRSGLQARHQTMLPNSFSVIERKERSALPAALKLAGVLKRLFLRAALRALQFH